MKLNPFDGMKVLYHEAYWSSISLGNIPPPILVTLDPINRCNLRCVWCNSEEMISHNGELYSEEQIKALPPALKAWGVRAVCIAGGGEPTIHPLLSDLIFDLVDHDIEVGVVTNGTRLLDHNEALSRCRWVGVSVDAGSKETYHAQKGLDRFDKVIRNISELRKMYPALEITYKFLIHPKNILEIPRAAQIADEIGCTYFHARPAGVTWEDIRKNPETRTLFSLPEVELGVRLLNAVAENTWPKGLKVVNTPGKFTDHTWAIDHGFALCHAVGMTCAIMPNGVVGLCCDRRGDPRVELCHWEKPEDFIRVWGSDEHLKILKSIKMAECPRCTYAPHNKLFEAFVIRDDTCVDFL